MEINPRNGIRREAAESMLVPIPKFSPTFRDNRFPEFHMKSAAISANSSHSKRRRRRCPTIRTIRKRWTSPPKVYTIDLKATREEKSNATSTDAPQVNIQVRH